MGGWQGLVLPSVGVVVEVGGRVGVGGWIGVVALSRWSAKGIGAELLNKIRLFGGQRFIVVFLSLEWAFLIELYTYFHLRGIEGDEV